MKVGPTVVDEKTIIDICTYASKGYDYKTAEPILVQIAMLNMKKLTNDELEEILVNKETRQKICS